LGFFLRNRAYAQLGYPSERARVGERVCLLNDADGLANTSAGMDDPVIPLLAERKCRRGYDRFW
jgi:hypothetical protein